MYRLRWLQTLIYTFGFFLESANFCMRQMTLHIVKWMLVKNAPARLRSFVCIYVVILQSTLAIIMCLSFRSMQLHPSRACFSGSWSGKIVIRFIVAHFEHDKCSGHESLHCECDKRIIFRNSLVAILICGLILWRIVGIRRCTLYRSAFARPKTLSHESYKRKYYRRFDEKKTCLEHASSHLGHIDSKNNTNRIRNGVSYEEIVICSRLR